MKKLIIKGLKKSGSAVKKNEQDKPKGGETNEIKNAPKN
ncbi:hypothetical protein UNSWCD_468 [Campylobacter concisus UNSWCD]|jgi:hypothetical protein|nr:hypothetical protein UNSWCD_468 [Campylobacter concisus UNSWCD]